MSGAEAIDHDAMRDQSPADSMLLAPPVFRYAPLDHMTGSIRLIQILPGPEDSVIRCEMLHTTIYEATYTCVSYTWEPEYPKHNIEINGHVLSVGHNLHQFLQAYRCHREQGELQVRKFVERVPRGVNKTPLANMLWIDAICIAQSDVHEKNHQVQQMGSIYSHAGHVLIWLGKLDSRMERFLQGADKYFGKNTIDYGLETKVDDRQLSRYINRELIRFHGLVYWSRVWIAQEILLAKGEVVVLTNRQLIGFRHLYLLTLWARLRVDNHGLTPSLKSMYDIYGTAFAAKRNEPATLPDLLPIFQHCGCRDRRDQIFALLSLTVDPSAIVVDYRSDRIALLRHVLQRSIDGLSIDEVLEFGANLIQAIDLRSPPEECGPLKTDTYRDELDWPLSDSECSIGMPVWTEATLEIQDHPHTAAEMTCTCKTVSTMLLPVFDNGDYHVLEYVVDQNERWVNVRYARTHEFVQRQIQAYEAVVEDDRESPNHHHVHGWLQIPSENVYYSRLEHLRDRSGMMAERPLISWKNTNIERMRCTWKSSKPRKLPRLVHPKRYWTRNVLGQTTQIRFDMFPDAQESLKRQLLAGNPGAVDAESPQVRGTLLRVQAKDGGFPEKPHCAQMLDGLPGILDYEGRHREYFRRSYG